MDFTRSVSPVLLGGYATRRCARRIHNDWDPTIERTAWTPPEALQARIDAGIAFESEVAEALLAELGDRCLDLRGPMHVSVRAARTSAAMTQGVDVILGGQLPDDRAAGRTGRPDLLLRSSETGTWPTYVPGDIKSHRMIKPSRGGGYRFSTFAEPALVEHGTGFTVRYGDRLSDYLQLAHYWRMLEADGFAPQGMGAVGFIIGTDTFADLGTEPAWALTWLALDEPRFSTFSRSRGSVLRSALERYDHEHDFRLKVAERALQRRGSPEDPEPLVVPFATDECDVCPWRDTCASALGPDAASVVITAGRLDVREWMVLARMGVDTVQDLAALDIGDDAFWDEYLPEVAHQAKARERLTLAVERARMHLAGLSLRRTTSGPLGLSGADVEIDLDIEWDADHRVYLWGALLTDGAHPHGDYRSFVSWHRLDTHDERALADQAASWLREQVHAAALAGHTVRIYHYASPEPSYLSSILGPEDIIDLLSHFEDLLTVMRRNFLGTTGLSIKQVAPAFGFQWRDEDPGGLQSQGWLVDARSSDPVTAAAARARILAYNEDDVRATAAVRAGLRANHEIGS